VCVCMYVCIHSCASQIGFYASFVLCTIDTIMITVMIIITTPHRETSSTFTDSVRRVYVYARARARGDRDCDYSNNETLECINSFIPKRVHYVV